MLQEAIPNVLCFHLGLQFFFVLLMSVATPEFYYTKIIHLAYTTSAWVKHMHNHKPFLTSTDIDNFSSIQIKSTQKQQFLIQV